MAWYQNDDGEWYSDEMLYSDTVSPDDVITYGPGDTYTSEDLVNPNNDFNFEDFVNQPQTYGDASSYNQYINLPDLTPTSSANVTANMSEADKQAIAKIMQQGSNANTATGGGPGTATDYFSALLAGLKAKTLDLASLSPTLQKAITGTTATPNIIDKIGEFLGTTTGKAVGIGGLAALLQSMGNKGTGEIYKGYQGGIPNYSASRTMNAIPTTTTDASGNTVARRPGQGGITYFSPMQYTAAGSAASSPAAGIAALPEANTASTAPAAGIAASSPAYSAPTLEFSTPNVPNMPPMAGPAPSAPPASVPATGIAASSPAYSAPTLEFSTPNVPNMPPMAGPAPEPYNPMGQASLGVVVYGPDGKAYGSPAEARNAGVSNPTMSPPAGAPASAPGAYSKPTLDFSTPNIVQRDPIAKAAGGLSSLGGYSDGGRGRLLRGPGDGVSDSIPAIIGRKQPARLADGEFVVPARVVSEIGNGSTEAGARKLYAMMDRVQKARRKTLKNVAANSRADKYLPA